METPILDLVEGKIPIKDLEEGLDLILINNSNSNLEDFSIDLSKDFNRDLNKDFNRDLNKDFNKDLNRDSNKRDPLLANKDLGLDSKDQDPILVNKVQVLEVQDLISDSKDSNKGLNFLSNMPKIIDMAARHYLQVLHHRPKRQHQLRIYLHLPCLPELLEHLQLKKFLHHLHLPSLQEVHLQPLHL